MCRAVLASLAAVLSSCSGAQSALEPAGRDAERLASLFWWMAGGAVVVWVVVLGLALWAIRLRPERHSPRRAAIFIIGGGVALPTVVLTVLLIHGLSMLPELVAPAPEGSLQIEVSAEQWWWRVRYPTPEGGSVELANEIRIPVGERVQFHLRSPDVIHAFWIPSLGGKIDAIPGRRTRLSLHATRTGAFRGVCAEYCGTAHAQMAFWTVVEERQEFDRWLAQQAQPARPPDGPLAVRGQEVFLISGCGACHSVRGTPADGVIGPDLTHVGGRRSLGAGILPNEPDDFVRWIGHTDAVKPGVLMPAFGMLRPEELKALAAYLEGLE